MSKPVGPWNYWTPNEEYLIAAADGKNPMDRIEEFPNSICGRCLLCPRILLIDYDETSPIGRLVMICPDCRDRFVGNYYRKN